MTARIEARRLSGEHVAGDSRALIEMPIADLCPSDIGSRIVVIDETGNAYDGTLKKLWAKTPYRHERPEERVRTDLEVASGDDSQLDLSNLPLDFRVQIERHDDYDTTTEESA